MKYIKICLIVSLISNIMVKADKLEDLNNKFWSFNDVISIFSEYISPTDTAKKLIKESFPVKQPHEVITVQQTTDLCTDEKIFLQNRTQHIQKILLDEFGIDKPLRLGFCCSGGGNRAMIGTLGCMQGAAKSKLLDVTTYLSGLSGSTWLITPLCYLASTSYRYESFETILSEIRATYHTMLTDYSMVNVNGIYAPPLLSFESTDDFLLEVAKRFAFDQKLTLVNMFGFLVGDYALALMGNDRLSEKWSIAIPEIKQGKIPLPLCSAIFDTHSGHSKPAYEWFEVSPLQVGSSSLGYLPIQYLGSGFHRGSLNQNQLCHEYPISFYLGLFGSAFAATIHDIGEIQKSMRKPITLLKDETIEILTKRNFFTENSFVQGMLSDLVYDIITARNALTYAHFPNYSQGLEGSVLRNESDLGLFDAGIDFDLPLPMLVDRPERNLDIVILYDSNPGGSNNLDEVRNYCHKKGVKFPAIHHLSSHHLKSTNMTVLNDPRLVDYDPSMITYLYLPTSDIDVSEAPYITFNFKYSPSETDWLANKAEQSLLSEVEGIKEIMKLVAEKRVP